MGIELVMDPAFTARAYRARNIICGQYASWAAEMHLLRMSVVSYFQCEDNAVDLLLHDAARLAEESRKRSPGFSINCQGVARGGPTEESNNVYLDFQETNPNHPLTVLQSEATTLVDGLPGAVLPPESGEFHPKINLMEYANLPPDVMAEAYDFSKGVAIDMRVPSLARAWRLVLLRYHSEAAGGDWSQGGWAPDLRWEILASYML
ncbi:MAG: hypothetical protein BZY87_05480 [SAR202 cluster bacterium Io17-Chloro-G6]|nr:MAG: hypothetical protein BZY87_05480 [SAR202 cluster bacterium Io17-Chloro-G6]